MAGSTRRSEPFHEAWPELRTRLVRVLAARGVPLDDREDLAQEAGLRLYRVWDDLDPEQSVWPYAVTVALNVWRDSLRAAGVRPREVAAHDDRDNAADLDVERAVIARDELAHVGAALRQLAPEQRRLVLETDEITAVVRPLRAAERMSRMRVRRELARVVGRASAIAALVWLRRPHRIQAMAAAAFTSALAFTAFSGAPAVSVAALPAVTSPVLGAAPPAAVRPVAPAVPAPTALGVQVAARHRAVLHRHPARPGGLCAPAPAPVAPAQPAPADATQPVDLAPVAGVVNQVATPPQVVSVPTAHTTDDGCVQVS